VGGWAPRRLPLCSACRTRQLLHAPGNADGGVAVHAPLQVPELVKEYMAGGTLLDKYVTHNMDFDEINTAFELLHSGKCLRCVLTFKE
jgi:S-(hydroxymethyl)glutathione dehydrogenase / alcohol dehydrogenase